MRKSTNTLTPAQVYRYAVECCQPHLQLRDGTAETARTICRTLTKSFNSPSERSLGIRPRVG